MGVPRDQDTERGELSAVGKNKGNKQKDGEEETGSNEKANIAIGRRGSSRPLRLLTSRGYE